MIKSVFLALLSSVRWWWTVLKKLPFASVVRFVVKFYFLVLSLVVLAVLLVVLVIIAERLILNIHARGNSMEWLGGLMQMIGDSVQNNKNLTATQLTNLQNRSHFKRDRAVAFDREDTAIQRRVRDAQAAGVHPLFALGGSVGSSPMFGTAAEAPQFRGDAGGAMRSMVPDRKANETHAAAIAESAARTKLMEAQAADIVQQQLDKSNAARATQRSNVQQDIIKVPGQAKEYAIPREGSGPQYSPFRPRSEKGWVTSKSATAQQAEDEYGEISDWTYGPYRALHDWVWYNEGWKYFVPHSVSQGVFRDNPPTK